MTTSHFCGGKWKPGSNEDCPKHKRLSKKQISVYRSSDRDPSSGSGSGGSGSSGGSKPPSA
jgi:hypothetical protein